ncbi:MAG: hypothetical protein JNL52_07790 [Flavobacteriales bacterium]|nr:hypothetical protein [Flavobacteriales bacterium]
MLVGLYRSNQPAVLLTLLVLVPGLFLGDLAGPVVAPSGSMVLFERLLSALGPKAWVHGLFAMGLMLLMAVQLTGLVNNADLADRRNHLPAFLFPVLLALFVRSALLDPALVGMPLVIWAMRRAWSINNNGPALSPLFDAGFLLGLAALFYLPYAFLVVVLWASISVIRPFQLREYIVPVLGLAVVLYLTWGVLHLNGATPWRPLLTIADQAGSVPLAPRSGLFRGALYVVLVPVLLVALLDFAVSYQRGVMQVKNLRSSFLAWGAALTVIILGVYLLNNAFPPVLLAAPLAVLCVHAFMGGNRKALRGAAAWALLAMALWAQWG